MSVITASSIDRTSSENHPSDGLWFKTAPLSIIATLSRVRVASFSVFTVGSLDGTRELWSLRVPRLLSFLATGTWDGEVEGIHQLQEKAVAAFRLDGRALKDVLIYGFKRSFFAGSYADKRDWVRSVLNRLEDQLESAGHDMHGRRP